MLSIYGAMFAADQEAAAAELLRVTKPGGRIGMSNWAPDGFVGEMFATNAKHLPPPPGVRPPLRWGTEEGLQELLGDGLSEMRIERKSSRQPFRSADHWIEHFRTYFGPTKVAFEKLGPEGGEALEADLKALLEKHNVAGERALVLESDYLQMLGTRA